MRKGDITMPSVVALAVTVVILLMAMIYFSNVQQAIDERIPYEKCRDSVYTAASFHTKLYDFPAKLNCPVRNVKIGDLSSESSQREAKTRIAQSMMTCFNQFGNGKLELYGGPGAYCQICDYVDFSDKKNTLAGMNSYLFSTKIPGSTKTYAESLAGVATFSNEVLSQLEKHKTADYIDPTKQDQYAVIFYHAKGRDSLDVFTDTLQTALIPAAGAIMGLGVMYTGGAVIAASAWTGVAMLQYTGVAVGGALQFKGGLLALGSMIPTVLSTYVKSTQFQWYSSVWFVPLERNSLERMGCTEVRTK